MCLRVSKDIYYKHESTWRKINHGKEKDLGILFTNGASSYLISLRNLEIQGQPHFS